MRTPRVVSALVLREMSTSYGRSVGGYFWAVAEPVAGIVLLTVAFSFVMRSPPLGTSFSLFYASGIVPFVMYNSIANKVAMSINFSRPLLIYPRVTYFDALLARFLLNGLTQLLVALLVLTVLLVATSDSRAILDFKAIALAIAMALGVGFGIGALNCVLFAVAPVWKSIWAIVNRPAFLVSGIFYTFDSVPDSLAVFLWFNPLIQITGQMRDGIYPTYTADYVSVTYVAAWAVVPACLGLFFLRRYHRRILNEL